MVGLVQLALFHTNGIPLDTHSQTYILTPQTNVRCIWFYFSITHLAQPYHICTSTVSILITAH